jgi:methyl-accepting chemotaxis protein WspA
MKTMTIWQRLNAVLLALVLVGVGLAWWFERASTATVQQNERLAGYNDHLHYDAAQMSEALRGLLLDPKSDPEREQKRHHNAEADLSSTIKTMKSEYADQAELVNALDRLNDFSLRTLGVFHARILNAVETNHAAAVADYGKNDPAISKQREDLFDDLTKQAGRVINSEAIRAQTLAVAGVACLIAVLTAAVFVGRLQSSAVTGPLNRLVAALERMRRGDFTERLALERHDEFGILADGLNRLADDLSGLVGQVQRSGIQVNTTSTEIAATAKEQQSTANQIAATTAQIGATSKQISATSKELVNTMNEVSQVSEDTAQLANSGQSAIARMESTMRQIMEASGSITAKLAVLSEKTANINSVVTTITKVADQTNLLSLNAAIEAEKAGEYGLGFAVVAMEIRRLADQTAVATYDIEKMVKEMQSAVAAGVMGMDKFSEEVRRGVEEIRQVSTQLAQIIHQVQTLTPRFQTVNEGMHAQATGAEQISETLTQLSDAAHQTAESLRQSNLAIEQLNEAAHGLQTSVARFKLEA